MTRELSHSEAAAAFDCQFRHAFAYTGQLTSGTTLRPRAMAPVLRQGRAWGAAVAAWHETGDVERAEIALLASLSLDSADQKVAGVYDPDEHQQMQEHLLAILADYTIHTDRLPLTRLEHELLVPIPSRGGRRSSNRYRLRAYLDGVHTDEHGRDWIVENKLRKQLQSFELIAKQRQTRWYTWAWRRETGREIAGVIVDERLNAVPAEVRRNKDGRPSKVQSCRPDTYRQAFAGVDGEPDPEVLAKLEGKRWHQRHVLLLTPQELDEAGAQLTSAASLIHQLDTGQLYPVRNPSPMRCPGCAFKEICTDYEDVDLIDALFERTTPKRDRTEPSPDPATAGPRGETNDRETEGVAA